MSKFVARDAVHVQANTFVTDETNARFTYQPTAGLDAVAFVNPNGQKVLVTYNSSPHAIDFALQWHSHAVPYRQPSGAMATFTWN